MFKINSGELKHPISIKRLSKPNSSLITPEYNVIYNTRAKVVSVRGNEYINAQAVNIKMDITFYIRYNPSLDIEKTDIIVYKNKEYDIVYLNNISEKHVFLEIKGVAHEY